MTLAARKNHGAFAQSPQAWLSLGPTSAREHRVAAMALLLALVLGASPMARAAAQERQRDEEEEADAARKRIEWFHQQRAYPLGFIPAGARQRAVEHFERMLRQVPESMAARTEPGVASLAATTAIWTPIGPQPINARFFTPFTSGRVTAIAVDPTNPDIVYVGGAQGGVWKTTDGGTSWTPLTDDQPSLATGSIAIAPSSPNIIYVGTGEQNGFGFDVYYGAGVLNSADGGRTWVQKGAATFVGPFGTGFFPGGGARIGSLAVHPTNPKIVLAGVQIFSGTNTGPGVPGIYCTSDGGDNWTNILPGAVGTEVFFATPTTVYAALSRTLGDPDNGVYKTTTFNASTPNPCTSAGLARVTNTGGALPTGNAAGRIEIAVAPSDPTTVYAAIADVGTTPGKESNNLLGMFKTTDGGATWAKLANTPDFCTPQCWFDLVVRVHPSDRNTVFAGGSATANGTLIRSTDGGSTWQDISSDGVITLHVDQHALAFTPSGSRLYVGNDGGVYRTDNPTAAPGTLVWSNKNGPVGPSGLALTQFYPGLSIHPTNPLIAFGGSQDNGTLKFAGSLAWTELTCGDGGWTAIDQTAPSAVYATCQEIDIRKSTDGGNLFLRADAAVRASGDRNNFIAPLVMDPSNSQRLYFGTYRVWQTADGASNWSAISTDLTGGNANASLTTIAVAPSNANVVYVGTNNGLVQVSTNALAVPPVNFSLVNTGLPNRSVTQVVVDPTNPAVACATFSGFAFGGDLKGHVFKTTNTGATWGDISCHVPDCRSPAPTDLPNTPVNDLVLDLDAPGTLYAATDIGVFITSDGGASWSPLGTGLPRVAVFSLKLHRPSRTLRAATHGRSMWDLQLGAAPGAPTISSLDPANAPAGSPDTLLTVNGTNFVSGATVNFGSTVLTPVSVSPTQLRATIPQSLLTAGGTRVVAVVNPGGAASNVVNFTVTDFALSSTPASVTKPAGQAASYTVMATASPAPFGNAVTLGCLGLPAASSCSFSPASVTPGASSANSALTISTTAHSAIPAAPSSRHWPQPRALLWPTLLALALAALALGARIARRRWLAAYLPLAALLLLLAFQVIGCGGGGSSLTPPLQTGTPAGSYTITVTGSAAGGIQRTTTIMLVVQ